MGVNLRPWRQDPARRREHHLIPFGWALGGTLVLAVGAIGAGIWLGLTLIGFRHFQREPVLPSATFYNLLKLVFGVAAGIGGLIALVVSYRKQRIAESAETRDRSRVFNERFTTAAQQLGAEQAAVRLAGVYAMAGLADDWREQRQTCIDVLCAYLRMPYLPEPPEAEAADRAAWRGFREVRHTILRVIVGHLGNRTRVSWQGHDLDFTGVVFDGGDFGGAQFSSGGVVLFSDAQFTCDIAVFYRARFSGGFVSFSGAKFTGGIVSFELAEFTAGLVVFDRAEFASRLVGFDRARFSGGTVRFAGAKFATKTVTFVDAEFSGGTVQFDQVEFSGGTVDFQRVSDWSVPPSFAWREPGDQLNVLLPPD